VAHRTPPPDVCKHRRLLNKISSLGNPKNNYLHYLNREEARWTAIRLDYNDPRSYLVIKAFRLEKQRIAQEIKGLIR